MRMSVRVSVAVLVVLLSVSRAAVAGPQHYGFGMSYLAAVEQVGSSRRLAVYEAPLRAKSAVWIPRWLDRSVSFDNVLPGGIAIGNFWPGSFGKDYLTALVQTGSEIQLKVLAPPECFTTSGWPVSSTTVPTLPTGTVLGCAAGDLRGLSKDQLMTAGLFGQTVTPESVKQPSRVIMICEAQHKADRFVDKAKYSTVTAGGGILAYADAGGVNDNANFYWQIRWLANPYIPQGHVGGANFGMVDGHVKFVRAIGPDLSSNTGPGKPPKDASGAYVSSCEKAGLVWW